MRGSWLVILVLAWAGAAGAQVDRADVAKRGGVSLEGMGVRVRVVECEPDVGAVNVAWRHGGEGLGGDVFRGAFASEAKEAAIKVGDWSAWSPLMDVAGKGGGWKFPSIVVSVSDGKKTAAAKRVVVEVEVGMKGEALARFVEASPKGATVGMAVPAGAKDLVEFKAGLRGLSGHAKARRETVEKAVGGEGPWAKKFGILGHLAGYGEGAGYGIRHGNPEIVKEEARTLQLLGMNGLVGETSVKLADAAGVGAEFRRVYWGGPGSGSPVYPLIRMRKVEEGCPFDAELPTMMGKGVESALAEHKRVGARESWGLWWDEIGVAAKLHHQECATCRAKFVEYVKGEGCSPEMFGKKAWDEVAVYPVWEAAPAVGNKAASQKLSAPPTERGDAERYYYSFRFMTYATAELFPASAKVMKEQGVLLYAMQGPTPSWGGHSLDWNEFYDRKPNTAFVWETSNRDARAWQWESYLGDIGRGIAERHGLPMGCLIKPHRGAPMQRMLSVASRGVTNFEWYTYGPDYAKGDSFSQSAELLEKVGKAGRFIAKVEDAIYGAKRVGRAEVAFVTPRSSEIWGKTRATGAADFEDAKWVWMALAHAHVPVDVLSERQLAEGKLSQYKVMYVVGPNLRRDAKAKVDEWVNGGGVLWTDALGLTRDEANQEVEKLEAEIWGGAEPYKATTLTPLTGEKAPAAGWAVGRVRQAGLVVRKKAGEGEVVRVGTWAGLAYSEMVRRKDFEMRGDFDEALRKAIVEEAVKRVRRPVVVSEPLVEAVLLEAEGKRSVALMNWAYAAGDKLQSMENVTVRLDGMTAARSAVHGKLDVKDGAVVLPGMDEVDVLILE